MTYAPKMWTKYSHLSYNNFIDSIADKLDDQQLAYLRQLEEAVDFFVEFGDSDPEALGDEIDQLSGIISDRDKEIDQLQEINKGLEGEIMYLKDKLEDLEDKITELQDQLNTINETKDY